MIVNILCVIFVLRPLIDLFWDGSIFFGFNLATLIALLNIGLFLVYILVKKKIVLNHTSVSLLAFVAYTGIITVIFMNSYEDLSYFIRVFSVAPYLIIVAPNISREKFEKILFAYILVSLVPIFISYLQAVGIVEYTYFDYVKGVKISRASGGYRQPSALTRVCIFSVIYVLYFWESKCTTLKQKVVVYVYLGLNAMAIFLSYHRTGYAMLVIVLLIWIYLKERKRFVKLIIKGLVVSCAILSLFFGAYFLGAFEVDLSTFQNIFSVDYLFTIENGSFDLALRGRDKIIEKLFLAFAENPWYNTVFGNGQEDNLISKISMRVADMDWIRVVWNVGLVGMIIYTYHYLNIFRNVRRIRRRLNNQDLRYRLVICVFVVSLIWGFTLETSNTPNIVYHLYFVVGYVYSSLDGRKAEEKRGNNNYGTNK